MKLVLSCKDLRGEIGGLICKARPKGKQNIAMANCINCDRPVELVPLNEKVA